MADISKCGGNDCPIKETCYRFTAKSSEFRQAYFNSPPYDKEWDECDYYWEVEPI